MCGSSDYAMVRAVTMDELTRASGQMRVFQRSSCEERDPNNVSVRRQHPPLSTAASTFPPHPHGFGSLEKS